MSSKRRIDNSDDDDDDDECIGPMPVPEQKEKKQKGLNISHIWRSFHVLTDSFEISYVFAGTVAV